MSTRDLNKMQNLAHDPFYKPLFSVPFGVTYEKIGTIQRRLAWPLHKDDTLSRSGRSTDLNIYFLCFSPCSLQNTYYYSVLVGPVNKGQYHFIYNEMALRLVGKGRT